MPTNSSAAIFPSLPKKGEHENGDCSGNEKKEGKIRGKKKNEGYARGEATGNVFGAKRGKETGLKKALVCGYLTEARGRKELGGSGRKG